jgi:hypothetical protein
MASTSQKGKDFEALRALHDPSYIVPRKIKAGLESLGAECWEYEEEFRKRCGINSPNTFAPFREQFKDFYIEVPGKTLKRIWAGSKAFATKIRSTLQ